jgi:hypothetical protein
MLVVWTALDIPVKTAVALTLPNIRVTLEFNAEVAVAALALNIALDSLVTSGPFCMSAKAAEQSIPTMTREKTEIRFFICSSL